MQDKKTIVGAVLVSVGVIILGIAMYDFNATLQACAKQLGSSCEWIAAPYQSTATQETKEGVEFVAGLFASIFGAILIFVI